MKRGKTQNEIGVVVSGSKPQNLKFCSLKQICEDYVVVQTEEAEEKVVYEITDVDAYNSRMDDMELIRYILPGEDYTQYNIYRANAKPLGVIKKGELLPIKKWFVAPPGKMVETADTQDISMVYGVERRKGKQKIGKIIRHEQIQVWLDFPKLLTTHMAIVGRSGQGKSNFVKILLESLPMKYIVFTKVDEYTNIKNAKKIDIQHALIDGNISSLKKIFELNKTELQFLHEYLKQSDYQTRMHTAELAEDIRKHYSDSPAPDFEQVSFFEKAIPENTIQLPKFVDSLCKKIESISIDIVMQTEKEEEKEPCIINMQKLSDREEEIALYTYLTPILEERRKCYKNSSQVLPLEDRIVIFLEEAHNYVPSTKTSFCKDIIRQIAREGRKLGIHLVMMSQRPRHLDPTALSQCGSIVSFNLTNPEDIDYLMNNANFYGDYYRNTISDLRIGECIIVSDYIMKGINCKVDFEK